MTRRSPIQGLRPKQEAIAMILYVTEAAHFLSCSEKAVRQRVARQLIPFRKLGGRVIFLRDELETFLRDLPGIGLAEAKANLVARSGEELRR
jgi:excisionase family DNA binding protein